MSPIPLQALGCPGAAASVCSLPAPGKGSTPSYACNATTRAALLGHCIVVAAFERHPVGYEVLRARQVLGPGIARDQGRRLPNDVELASSPTGGGNVQRTVLARELGGKVDVMLAANPCFGLVSRRSRRFTPRSWPCATAALRFC